MTAEYQQSPEDERMWRAHIDYIRRTAAALQVSVTTAQRAISQAGRELQDLGRAGCGADCCIGTSDRSDADHELEVATRRLRHVERIATGLLAQVEAQLAEDAQ